MRILGQYMLLAFLGIWILSDPLVVGGKKQILRGELFSMFCIDSDFTGDYVEFSVITTNGSKYIIGK